ncbi:MAG: type I glutamate--ammonia ligase [Candidatus Ancillula sp.]|jgi:glutamine synthetase|nr:type I glutamate--ammonia ligase [Candidatus Ancillula sp.]
MVDSKQVEYALRTVEDRNVRFVRLWFTDVLGQLKSVAIAPAELENAIREGIGFDGSSIEGLARIVESDMIAKPDPSTFQLLPWRGGEDGQNGTARMFCDLYTPEGEPSLNDSRFILKRALKKAKEQGLTFYTHPEIEFYLFDQVDRATQDNLIPVDDGGYFDHVPRSSAQDFRRDVINMLEKMGISVEFSHHEAGPGQNEIDLRYADALTTADNILTFRTVVKEVALQMNMRASFMPKPLGAFPGSGMHTHVSIFEGENNLFYDANSPVYNLSQTGQHFIAGILKYSDQISLITNQFVNSYKRITTGAEAPGFACCGTKNHSAMIRVPNYKPNKGQTKRVEIRSLDSAVNPYLAFAVLLEAGLQGVEQKLPLPEEINDNLWQMSSLERKALGVKPLPHSLNEAIKAMEESDLVAEVLGESVFEHYLKNKYEEWSGFQAQVSQFEMDYLFKHL